MRRRGIVWRRCRTQRVGRVSQRRNPPMSFVCASPHRSAPPLPLAGEGWGEGDASSEWRRIVARRSGSAEGVIRRSAVPMKAADDAALIRLTDCQCVAAIQGRSAFPEHRETTSSPRVIPGCAPPARRPGIHNHRHLSSGAAMQRRTLTASPVSMDSGLALRAPRNDVERGLFNQDSSDGLSLPRPSSRLRFLHYIY